MHAADFLKGSGSMPAPDARAGGPAVPRAARPAAAEAPSADAAASRAVPAPSVPAAAPSPAPALPAAWAALAGWLRRRAVSYLLGAVSIGSALLLWHLATTYRLDFYIRFGNIPTPADVAAAVVEVSRSGQFATHIGLSMRRILLGFLAAALLGIGLGVLIGRYRRVRELSMPALEVFRPIPAIAWVPMSIMLWPDNEVSIVFITFIGAFFPILLNTVHGVESVDPVLLRAARCLGAKEGSIILHVILPGALPHVFTGLAVGMGVAWVSLIAAEMISGQFGIGYFTWEAYSLISYAEIALGMITIGVLGLLCSGAIRLGARVAMPWTAHATQGGRA